MKKILLISLLMLLASPLMRGQDKNILANGRHLMPIRPLTQSEKQIMVEHRFQPTKRLAKVTDLPPAIDNTAFMPPVVDQGSEGSCTAFASAYALDEMWNMKNGYSLDNQFSQSFVFNLETFQMQGEYVGALGWAFSVLQEAGACKLSDFPYIVRDFSFPSIDVMHKALNYRIDNFSWFYVGDTLPPPGPGMDPVAKPGYTGINIARSLLADGQPVVMTITLWNDYGNPAINSGLKAEGWVYSYAEFGQEQFSGGHALCIVGYNDTLMTKDGPGAFKVINSWGTTTGGLYPKEMFDSGYCWLSYKLLAEREYAEQFYTFTLRSQSQPELTAEFQLKNWGGGQGYGIVMQNQTKEIWKYRWSNRDSSRFTHSVVDLSDLLPKLDLEKGVTFFLSGYWTYPIQQSYDPTIVSIHVVDSLKGVDTLISANLVIKLDTLKPGVNSYYWQSDNMFFKSTITGITDVHSYAPDKYKLSQNYPNPFNPTTTINFSLSKSGQVTLKVYDLLGREVATLINGYLRAGAHNTKFDASHLSSGVYIYRIQAGDYTATKKMILMK